MASSVCSSSNSTCSSSKSKSVSDVFLFSEFDDEISSFVDGLSFSLREAGIQVTEFRGCLGPQVTSVPSDPLVISVVVLTRKYVNCESCRQILELILSWWEEGCLILPLFYDIDMVKEARGYLSGMLENTVLGMFHSVATEWRRWRNFSALNIRNQRSVIEKIKDIMFSVFIPTLYASDNVVELEHAEHVIELLMSGSNCPLILEIWGEAGIGKTSIAKTVYNKIGNLFEGKCFLANIEEVWEQDDGQVYLQEQLLSDILETKKLKMHSIEERKTIMREMLQNRRVLLVLDDVTTLDQVNVLCGSGNWFGPGSRIIVTTRARQLLCTCLSVDYILGVSVSSSHCFCSMASSVCSSSNSTCSFSKSKSVSDVFLFSEFDDEISSFVDGLSFSLREAGIQVTEFRGCLGPQVTSVPSDPLVISVVVLTRKYVNCESCRQILELILSWWEEGCLILPLFYDIDMVKEARENPSGMLENTVLGMFHSVATEWHRWRNFSALNIRNQRSVIEKIKDFMFSVFKPMQYASDNVVVLERAEHVIELVMSGSNCPLILEIWGEDGIGKTSIAKTVYNKIGNLFEGKCFLANIKEVWEQDDGQVYLQEQLLSDILETKKLKIHSIEERKTIMREMLQNRRILLVLDDVTTLDQVNVLCGSGNWLGPGSRIIVTSRAWHPVSKVADFTYEVRPLDLHEAQLLFWWHAFKQRRCRPKFKKLSATVVSICRGLPLALEVLGSVLFKRKKPVWENIISRLKAIPKVTMLEILKLSHDDLDDLEKDVFLDISCFFIGKDRHFVIQMLNDSGVPAETIINMFMKRKLVTVDEKNMLQMHDLLKQMGREIIVKKPKYKLTYDVFLSFRGEETRRSFTTYLYAALTNAGIKVFMDNDLERGEDISSSLLKAIEDSRISIIIFSTNYAGSKWCLDELEKIIECQRTNGQGIMPVFYDVDPSDIRNQRGTFGQTFDKLVKTISASEKKVSSWRTALTRTADFSGWHSRNYGTEFELIDRILETISKKINDSTHLFIANHPVGVISRVQDVRGLIMSLKSKSDGVCIVGIWGMSGIGKTTIAKAIYNEIGGQFKYKTFLSNIKEVWEHNYGPVYLQEQLLSDILKIRRRKLHSVELGKTIIKESFHQKKVLIMLDDVNKLEQLYGLCGSHEWFGSGSAVIITTQDEHLLSVLQVDAIYKIKKMGKNESVELFSWHAFKQASPPDLYNELSDHLVRYSGGLPLALEVLGSYLYNRSIPDWKSVLRKLERIPNNEIQKKLRLCFDGLNDDMEKDIFLDICCFLVGKDRHYVTEILNGCGFEAEIGISTLIERSLITVDNKNKLQMHNLIRDMGREIVREESPKHPAKRSRLWFRDDIVNVLMKHSGTEAIEGFALKFPNINDVPFNTKAFEKMEGLRLIQLDHVELTGDYKYLPKSLKWLCWHGFPLGAIPDDFDQRSLVAIDLKYSKLIQVWLKPQLLERLKFLNLSHSRRLTQTPDFSKLPNLERLLLKDCSSLSSVHPSIGSLSKLLLVNLKDCKNLNNLPRSIYKLKSLKSLIISGCSMINKLEEDIEQMESLTTLMAADTAISCVPFSLVRLKNIGYLSLCGYDGLPCDVFPHLIWSWMPPVSNLPSFNQAPGSKPSFLSSDIMDNTFHDMLSIFSSHSYLRSLKFQCQSKYHIQQDKKKVLDALYAMDCTELETRAGASQMLEMGTSILRNKDNQVLVSGSQSSSGSLWIYMGEHSEASNSHKKIILQGQSTGVFGDWVLTGDKYSDLLTYKGEGSSVSFKMPQVIDRKFKGIAICVGYSSSLGDMPYKYLRNVLIINHTKATIQLHKREVLTSPKVKEWQFIMSDLEPGDKVEIVVDFRREFTVDTTTANLVYGESIDHNL